MMKTMNPILRYKVVWIPLLIALMSPATALAQSL